MAQGRQGELRDRRLPAKESKTGGNVQHPEFLNRQFPWDIFDAFHQRMPV